MQLTLLSQRQRSRDVISTCAKVSSQKSTSVRLKIEFEANIEAKLKLKSLDALVFLRSNED